jgi:1-acyl-sn-glycerol-3-phosphate acyltransferase
MVTIANDSGRLWPRKGLKLPGVVTFRYGEPVPPGLPRDEAEARAHAGINVLDTAAD